VDGEQHLQFRRQPPDPPPAQLHRPHPPHLEARRQALTAMTDRTRDDHTEQAMKNPPSNRPLKGIELHQAPMTSPPTPTSPPTEFETVGGSGGGAALAPPQLN